MVRTKADNSCKKAVSAKAPRKIVASAGSSGAGSSSAVSPKTGKPSGGSGNSVCVRPIPNWQKGIAGFLVKSSLENGGCTEADIDPDAGPSTATTANDIIMEETDTAINKNNSTEIADSSISNGNQLNEKNDRQPVSEEEEGGSSGAKRGQKKTSQTKKKTRIVQKNGMISDSDSD